MLFKTKMALAGALVLGSATAGFAQRVVPEVDGHGNRTLYNVPPQGQAGSAIERGFAGPRHHAHRSIERSFAGPRVYWYGANGPAWQEKFNHWLTDP